MKELTGHVRSRWLSLGYHNQDQGITIALHAYLTK
jgi:hypothetical protein